MRDVMTNAEMQASINAGIPVLYKGKVLRTLAELPSDGQILLDFPEYAYNRIEGNAKGILGYQIVGTPTDTQTLIFNGTDKKWEFGAGGGGSTSPGGSNKQIQVNASGSFGGATGFEYDATADWTLSQTPASGKTGMVVYEPTSTPPATVVGAPSLLQIHVKDGSTYWGLGYSSDATAMTWANYLYDDGTLIFQSDYNDNSGQLGVYFNPGTTSTTGFHYLNPASHLFAAASSTYGGILEESAGVFGLTTCDSGDGIGTFHTSLTWRATGITQAVPSTALIDANIPTGHAHFYLDEASDTFNVKWKESGGTVFTKNLSASASPAGSGTEIQARGGASSFGAVTGSSTTNGDITLVGQAVSGGDVLLDMTPGASTAIAAEVPTFVMRTATLTTNATVADYRFNQFLRPTLASNSSRTTTNAATLYVDNAPAAGTNMTITNPYALWVDAGNTRLDGFLGVGTTAPAATQFYVQAQSSGNITAQFDSSSGANVDIMLVRRGTTNIFQLTSGGKAIFTSPNSGSAMPYFRIDSSADTVLGGSEIHGIKLGGDSSGNTVTRQFSSTFTTQREYVFTHPTYSMVAASQTITNAATVAIKGAPIASTNLTITNPYALWVQSGSTKHSADGIGTTNTTGIELSNETAASVGAQQISPDLIWTAQGWKTTATAGSQTVNWKAYVLPVQGTTSPTSNFILASQINGGGFVKKAVFNSSNSASTGGLEIFVGNTDTQGSVEIAPVSNSTIDFKYAGGIRGRLSGGLGAGNDFAIITSSSTTTQLYFEHNVGMYLRSGNVIGFNSTSAPNAFISSTGAANVRFGANADVASPVAQTLSVQNVIAGTTDTAGASWTFAGSRGTGTGAGGSIIFQTAPAGSTGSSQNSLVNTLTLTATGTTGQVAINDGNGTTTAGLKFSGDASNTGWSRDTSFSGWFYSSAGTKLLYMTGSTFRFASGTSLIWASSTDALTLTNGVGFDRSGTSTLRLQGSTSTTAATLSTPAISPSQITSDQNNYAPGVGWFQRWSSDASRNVTGLAAGVDGQIIEIWNVGAQNIVLQNENASSTAANRFATSTGADLTLTPNKCAKARYDSTSTRWRIYLCN